MRAADLGPKSPGRLVSTVGGGSAFVPDPLPPTIELRGETVVELSRADRALGALAGYGSVMPNPRLLIAPFVRREAVLSSRIEGTTADVGDLALFDVSPDLEQEVPDVREVANYVEAMQLGLARLASLPLGARLIRELHERLMTGVRGSHKAPGEFRTVQNWIGPPGSTIQTATYVPPPPQELGPALSALERFLHDPRPYPPLVCLALVHYQFEAIHPFLDGNGRVGRLLNTLWLCEQGLLPQPLLYLSAYFEKHRAQYYEGLLGVTLRGEWEGWIRYFLAGVTEQAEDAVSRAAKLVALRDDYLRMATKTRGSARTVQLVELLFETPAVTIAGIAASLGVSFAGAQGLVERLEEVGILREITGFQRNRIYRADGIIEAVE